MMSGIPLETCWAFNKRWNNKIYYKVPSCWLFLLIHTTMHGSINMKPVWNIPDAVCTILDSWWWTERPSETCRVLFQNKINLRFCASSWFYYRNILRRTVLQSSNLSVFFNFNSVICRSFEKTRLAYTTETNRCYWYMVFTYNELSHMWHS